MTLPITAGSLIADTYRITAQLGVGGMGTVWAADHVRLPGKRVAVKILHAALASGEVLLRFRREAEIASRIGHPNIVEVLDFNTLPGGEPYLVMELLAGESLAERLRRGALPEKTALAITRQIASALFAVHRMNVVHRDLKPDNIFLCPREVDGELRDHVKVLDFGISKIRNSQTVVTQDAAILGTPYYMSPEQASGKNQEIDGRTDLFALGAILFEMLTGTTAFPGDSLPSVIYQVVFQPHPALLHAAPSVSPALAAAVDRALAKNPADRFPDMSAFALALTGRPLMAMAGDGVGAAAESGGEVSAQAASAVALEPTLAPAAASTASPASVAAPSTFTSKGKKLGWLVFGVLGLALLALAVALGLGWPTSPPLAKPVAKGLAPSPSLTAPALQTVQPASVEAPVPAPPTVVAVKANPSADPATTHPTRPSGREESLPATVVAELDAAEQALRAKDAAEAIRRARHSLYEKKSSRASAILTRAYCLQGDLGAAKAELSHVAPADRPRVLRACRTAGTALQ